MRIAALRDAAQPPKGCPEGAAQHVGFVYGGNKEGLPGFEGEAKHTNAQGVREFPGFGIQFKPHR